MGIFLWTFLISSVILSKLFLISFDLGGLASNNNFNEEEERYLLENYFEKKISSKILIKYKAIKCASLLRETMWSMVSEITSKIEFDYKTYTSENLDKFNKAYEELK